MRIGRRSFYRLSDKGLRLTRRAEHKIYRANAPEWDGTWLLLLSEGLEKTVLAEVKKQLLWQGFGALAFVGEKGESSVGELPAPGPLYFQRFGGLPGV